MRKFVFGFLILLILVFVIFRFRSYSKITDISSNSIKKSAKINKLPYNMKITSRAFENNQTIPAKYTCDGENINPPLQFSNIPPDTKSLVLLMDDPDVPKNLKPDGVFDHWVVYNISANDTEIKENSTPPGTQGLNGAGQNKYTGPCPPDREHRYFFKLYALDTTLNFDNPEKVDKKQVEEKIKGHIISQTELIGLYDRNKH